MQQLQPGRTGLHTTAWATGVLLGFAGALLDFYSGYLILVQAQMVNGMGMVEGYTSTGLTWGIGLAFLGVVLFVSSVALVLPSRMNRMGDFGALMVVYGFAMLFIGSSMYLGLTSMMSGVFSPALAMLAVGVLMIANGTLMRRR